MILFLVVTIFLLGMFHCLGYVKGTLRHEMRNITQIHGFIMNHRLGRRECSRLYELYTEWISKLELLRKKYSIEYKDSEYLHGLHGNVIQYLDQTCPDIISPCTKLTHEQTVCDSDQFGTYYRTNIETQSLDEKAGFHDGYKRNMRHGYPCSINVYKDFTTNGYLYNMKHEKQSDGSCKQVISGHIEHDKFSTFQ